MSVCGLWVLFLGYSKELQALLERPSMAELRELFQDMSTHIATQNRDILDMTLPTPVVEEALSALPHQWYETSTVLTYAKRDIERGEKAEVLTTLEAFRRWGAIAMETAREKRWWPLPQA